MPPRKKKCTPKAVSKILSENAYSYANMPKEVLQSIQDLEEQVQERSQGLLALATSMQQAIHQEFSLKLMLLPNQVKRMQIKVFKEQYGADIQSVLLKDRQEQMAASIAAAELPATGLRTRAGAGTVIATQRRTRGRAAATPAVNRTQLSTLMRAPAPDETIYSANGSPLGFLQGQVGEQAVLKTSLKGGKVMETPFLAQQQHPHIASAVTTVVQANRPGSKTGVPDSMTFTLKDGQQVTVSFDGGLDKVPNAHREEVADLYHAHMDGLQKFAAAFKKNNGVRK